MALELEMKTFRRLLPTMLVNHRGKHVLIHKEDIVGFYPDVKAAITAGESIWLFESFLCREVTDVEKVYRM
jgi:hypothetical protein